VFVRSKTQWPDFARTINLTATREPVADGSGQESAKVALRPLSQFGKAAAVAASMYRWCDGPAGERPATAPTPSAWTFRRSSNSTDMLRAKIQPRLHDVTCNLKLVALRFGFSSLNVLGI
jgi:hypothetical protein